MGVGLLKKIWWILLVASSIGIAYGELDVNIYPREVIVPPDYEDPIVLRCKVEQIPPSATSDTNSEIHWTKNQIPITNRWQPGNSTNVTSTQDVSKEIVYLVDDLSLFIGALTPSKEGRYACTARIRTAGEIVDEERATARVYFAKINDFSFTSSDTEVDQGSFATLACISGFSIPPVNITWTKSGGETVSGIQNQHILKHDLETGMYMTSSSLLFSNITTKEHGEYSCVAVNDLLPSQTKISKRMFLRVKEKPSAPRIILQPETVYAVEGQPSRFLCISSGSPTPKITWYRNNVNIDSFGQVNGVPKLTIDSYGHTSVLAVESTTNEVTGEYKCLAENENGREMSDTAELQITSFSWTFVQEPENTEVHAGEAVTMICRPPPSQPPAVVSWYKDNQLLDTTNTTKLRQLSVGDLYISEVRLKDAGKYFCHAYNSLRDDTATSKRARLTVYAEPTLTELPDTLDVVIEHTVKLECNTTGFPFPVVEWTKNGLSLVTDERIIVGMRKQTLFITSATISDEALYGCRASNKFGNVTTGPTLLKVLVPPVIYTEVPDNVLIDLDQPYVVNCSASGIPKPDYIWRRDDNLLDITTESRYSLAEKGLMISNVQENDFGIYNCTASNKAGITSSTGVIRVKVPAQILAPPEDISVVEYGNINVSCYGRGYPDVTFEWNVQENLRDDSWMNKSVSEYRISYFENGTTISINNVTRKMHSGKISCKAKNFWSSANNSATITVLTKPVILDVQVSHSSPIVPGTNVTFNCTVEGRPEPTIKWLHRSYNENENSYIETGVDGHDGRILEINSIEETHEGTFVCEASNSVGTISDEISIVILDLPNPVMDLKLETVSNTSIEAWWSSDDFKRNRVKSYKIYYAAESIQNKYTTLKLDATEGRNEATIHGLKPATTYFVQISAGNDAGEGDWSFRQIAITHPGTPSPPTAVSIRHVTSYSFEVRWMKPNTTNGEIVEYELKYHMIFPGEYYSQKVIKLPNNRTGTQHYRISGLEPFSTYIVSVKAGTLGHNGTILWGETSPHVSVDTHEAAPSRAPANVEIVSVSETSANVTWKFIPVQYRRGIIKEYRAKYLDISLNISDEVVVNASERSFTLTGLSPWRNYSVQISAATSDGFGPWSDVVTFTTLITAPDVAVNWFVISTLSNDSVTFSWDLLSQWECNGPGVYYLLKIWKKQNKTETAEHVSHENNLTVDRLLPWTSYKAKIRAHNDAVNGSGPWSQEISFRTDESEPSAVVRLQAIDVGWDYLTIQWEPPIERNGELTGYQVKYNTVSCANEEYRVDLDSYTCVTYEETTSTSTQTATTAQKLDSDVHKQKSASFLESERNERMIPDHKNSMSDFNASAASSNGSSVSSNTSVHNSIPPQVFEGLLMEEFVAFQDDQTYSLYNITFLLEAMLYKISVSAFNGAGVGQESVVYRKTTSAPTTTALPTTTVEGTTTAFEYESSTQQQTTPTKSGMQYSFVIAGGTGGAMFICIIIALVAAAKCVKRKNSSQTNKKEDFVPTSSILPGSFHESLSNGSIEMQQNNVTDPRKMATFIGPTEESTPKEVYDSTNKYSVSHYKRYNSPSPDDSDTEFEYAVIQDGVKAFADSLAAKHVILDEPVYAKFETLPSPRNRRKHQQSSPRKQRSGNITRKITNVLNAKALTDNETTRYPNWTLRSSSITSYDSVTSHSLKLARKLRNNRAVSEINRTPPQTDIDNVIVGRDDVMGDGIPVEPPTGNLYLNGQNNTNNNKVSNPQKEDQELCPMEDTYM